MADNREMAGMGTPLKTLAGEFSDHRWLGDPGKAYHRQFASVGGPGYMDDVNLADDLPTRPVDLFMVPDFMGMSGQGANQSTWRPKGST